MSTSGCHSETACPLGFGLSEVKSDWQWRFSTPYTFSRPDKNEHFHLVSGGKLCLENIRHINKERERTWDVRDKKVFKIKQRWVLGACVLRCWSACFQRDPVTPKALRGQRWKYGLGVKLYTANVKQTSQMRRNPSVNSVQSEVRRETSLSSQPGTRTSFER